MFQIVLVDDSRAIRDGLSRHVPWEELGFKLVGSANRAQAAIQLIESNCVDVLLTDIVMDAMTGLDLIYFAKLINPDIRVIILSAYDKFEYAQKAIQLGADCFLTKPVDLGELKKELLSIKESLLQSDAMRRKNMLFVDMARRHFFAQLLDGGFKTDRDIRENAKQIELEFPTGSYALAKWDLSSGAPLVPGEMERALSHIDGAMAIQNEPESAIFIIFTQQQKLADNVDALAKALGREFFAMGVSGLHIDLSEFSTAMDEALHTLEYSRLNGKNSICLYSDLKPPLRKEAVLLPPEQEAELLRCLSEQDQAGYERAILEIISGAAGSCGAVRERCLSILLITGRHIGQVARGGEFVQNLELLQNAPDKEILDYLQRYAANVFNKLHIEHKKVSNQIVDRAMQYILEHYSENITLDKLSEQVYVNPMYLSRLFKEKAGVSYIEYLTEVRIENAKRLLSDLSLRIYDIVEMVGYDSRKHFGKIFKEHTGLSPKEYRNSLS